MNIDIKKQLKFSNIHNDKVEMNLIGIGLNIPLSLFTNYTRRDKWFSYNKRRRKFDPKWNEGKFFYHLRTNAIREGVRYYTEALDISTPYAGVISEVEQNYVPPKVLEHKELEIIYATGRALLYKEICGCCNTILRLIYSKFKVSRSFFKIIKSLSDVESGIDIQIPIANRDEFIDLIRDNLNRISTTSTFKYHNGDHTISTGGKSIRGSSWDVINETGDTEPAGNIDGVRFKIYEKAVFKGLSLIRIEATFTSDNMDKILDGRSFTSEKEYLEKLEVLNRWAFDKIEKIIAMDSPMKSSKNRETIKAICRSFLNKDVDVLVELLRRKDRIYVGKNSNLPKYLKRKIPLLEKEGIFTREPGRGAWYRFNPEAPYKDL